MALNYLLTVLCAGWILLDEESDDESNDERYDYEEEAAKRVTDCGRGNLSL